MTYSSIYSRCGWTVPIILFMCLVQGTFIYLDRASKTYMCGDTEVKVMRSDNYDSSSPLKALRSGVNNLIGSTTDTIENDANTTTSVAQAKEESNAAVAAAKPAKKKFYYKPIVKDNDFPNEFEGVWARAFTQWDKDREMPCFEAEPDWNIYRTQMSHTYIGINFLKSFKTGSSTASGINIRLARNVAKRQKQDFALCKTRHDHAWASKLFHDLDHENAVLWTIVRDPTSRLVSQFFHFMVSREKMEPSDQNFIEYVRNKKNQGLIKDYYLSSMTIRPYKEDVTDRADTANSIFEDYDFVAITERMDESAVALAMILNLPIADVLYLKAKGHGGFDDGGGRAERICTYIWPAFVSEGMEEFFESDEYQALIHWDHVFYEAANRSLDLTIEKLGRDKFEANLAKYKEAKEVAHDKCLPRTKFPCTAGGDIVPPDQTDCMWNDSACGMDCLDEVATELELW